MAELPTYVGKYKIEALVARGGMGAVLKATHPTLRRHVVLKKLTIRGNASHAERFKREARILMDFQHDNIVRVFDHFKEGSSYYMVLEYVDGLSLDQLLRKRRFLSSELALAILLEAGRALAYAHSMGVIHRDIKPGNILISRKGEVKLADFGIASSEDDDDPGLTKEGMTLGTPCYMPPEQIENAKNVDKRADLYALGVMLYEMVTGKKPYPGNFSAETLTTIRKGRYRPARKINKHVHPFVERLIAKLMRPDPKRRLQDAERLNRLVERRLRRYKAEALNSALIGLVEGSLADEPSYPRARRRLPGLPLAGIVARGLGSAAFFAWNSGYAHRWLLSDSYGLLTVSLRVPKSGRQAGETFARARIFVDDGADMPEAQASPLDFQYREGADADPYRSLAAKPVFLPPGDYRLKLVVGDAVHWESFTLPALSAPGGKDGVSLRLRVGEGTPRPLSVSSRATDAATGLELEHRLEVLASGAWRPVAELSEGSLMSGGVIKLRLAAEGYEPRLFSLKLAPDQDRLSIAAALSPLGDASRR